MIQTKKPLILGHRGASKKAPENTMAAFELALEEGADGFELDTMLCADGTPVVIHDNRLERTTDGIGKVLDHPYKDLQQFNAGAYFSDEFDDERIPSLEEVFIRFKNRAIINIELKNYLHPFDGLANKVVALAKKHKILDQLIVSSFNVGNIIYLQRTLPEIPSALLTTSDMLGRILSSKALSSISRAVIHPHKAICTEKYIAGQHAINRKVNTWTVNDTHEAKQLISAGIDGIITDDPGKVREIVG